MLEEFERVWSNGFLGGRLLGRVLMYSIGII